MTAKDLCAMNNNSFPKYLPLVFVLTIALVFAFGTAQAFAKDDHKGGGYSGGHGGGYSGPGPAVVTAEQAKGMKDDAKVTLRGKIVQHLGGKHYVFQDATGTIDVEISDKRWQGQNIGPDDLVEIYGEVDKEWSKVKIEVKRISKQ